MKYRSKKYRSVLLLQIALLHIHTTYSIHFKPQNYIQFNDPNPISYEPEESTGKELADALQEDKPSIFLRKPKSENQARMFSIDLSRLRHDTPLIHSGRKPPVNLVGIDISVLSRNPDPSLPLASKLPKEKINGKYIMGYDFDSFDRLPVIRTKPIRTYVPMPPRIQEDVRGNALLPMMFVPLNVMTSYHSFLGDKKHNNDYNDDILTTDETELKYTADFILHLLYQLSSNYKKITN